MNNIKTEQIKKILISEQQGNSPSNQLIDDIISGKVELLSEKDICKKLNLNEKEFIELVKQSDPKYDANGRVFSIETINAFFPQKTVQMDKFLLNYKKSYSFPKPDIYIVGKARWTTDTLRNWLLQGAK